jgi:hypothetical protein
MPPMEENNDFLNQKQNPIPNQKQDLVKKLDLKQNQQQGVGQKKKGSVSDKDGNLWGEKLRAGVNLTNERKQLIIQKFEKVKNILLQRGIIKNEKQFLDYKEYKELNDYHKYTLVATNYWHVMNDSRFINVPIEDTHFWFYFDEKCFDRCEVFQKTRKIDNDLLAKSQEEHRLSQEKFDAEKLNVKQTEPVLIDTVIEPEKIIEPEVKTKATDMPIEENKDFLKEKQEHPVYPKREKIEVKKEPAPEDNPVEKKQKPEPKTKKIVKKNNNEEQGSLF